MNEWLSRLRTTLEPVLSEADPRPKISAYHDMPYAIFRYPPEDEFAMRTEIGLLRTRLSQKGKDITVISLAECLDEALEAHAPIERLADAERDVSLAKAIETVHEVLASYAPLVDLVINKLPPNPDPLRNMVFIVRAGALFSLYRVFSLLEQLKGHVNIPAVLFYPGEQDGGAGLRFMNVIDAEHNYRPKIF